jgi:non-ribosomal peptide synthetase component F/aryl carrier-like protein
MGNQVRIRGMRVELGEIEHVLTRYSIVHIAVAIAHEDERGTRVVSFVKLKDHDDDAGWTEARMMQVHEDLIATADAHLPAYMVPELVFVAAIPTNSNGKVERKELARTYVPAERIATNAKSPTTAEECFVRDVWADVFNISAKNIDRFDSFFRLGGDSVSAMRTVSAMDRAGASISVADLLGRPSLYDLASIIVLTKADEPMQDQTGMSTTNKSPPATPPPAFSLLNIGVGTDLEGVTQQMRKDYPNLDARILDAYQCTPLQAGLVALAQRNVGDYVAQYVLTLHPGVDDVAFRAAWEYVVRLTPILRTRFLQLSSHGLVQAVLGDVVPWTNSSCTLSSFLDKRKMPSVALGQRLVHFDRISDISTSSEYFVFTTHHGLYDGFSRLLILEAVEKAYMYQPLQQTLPFQSFIARVRDQTNNENTVLYWKSVFDGHDCIPFPSFSPGISEPILNSSKTCKIALSRGRGGSDITVSTLVRAAVALVVGRPTGTDDGAFGVVVSGRNADVKNSETIVGPTIATIPVRVNIHRSQTISKFLGAVQKTAVDTIPFEQTGLLSIRRSSPAASHACDFQTLLVVQPQELNIGGTSLLGTWQKIDDDDWFDTYALVLTANLNAGDISITAQFDSRMIRTRATELFLQHLQISLERLANPSTACAIADISFLTTRDLDEIWAHNAIYPAPCEKTIVQIFAEQVAAHPDAAAICTWDSEQEITYAELDRLSSQTAAYLIDRGLSLGSIWPICSEKSMWVIVALLGVIKAGGAFLLLDPSLPDERLRLMVLQVNGGRHIISSAATRERCQDLADVTTVVDGFSIAKLSDTSGRRLFCVKPSALLYVVFTSGSTGLPKGVMISHENIASAMMHQMDTDLFKPGARLFDGLSYNFDFTHYTIFMALLSRACVCSLSHRDRLNDVEKATVDLRATSMILTPLLARILSLQRLSPTVHTIMFGGEALSTSDSARWWTRVQVKNIYGPCECTPVSASNYDPTSPEDAMLIGRGKRLNT